MAHKNHMKVKTRSRNNPDAVLEINLADDKLEVRGFGQPIKLETAKEMAKDYYTHCQVAWNIVEEIAKDAAFSTFTKRDEFKMLQSLIDPHTQTVSGIFGKEIILQILSQKGCEGIRYIQGKDNDKTTIILVGVTDTGEIGEDRNRMQRAKSIPVKPKPNTDDPADITVIGEVHEDSLTLSEAEEFLSDKSKGFNSGVDVLFGAY